MIGKTLGHYRVVEKLGEGGMGVVYRAQDTRLGRDVAIKVLPEDFARNPDRLARFEREARLLASLNHPNIAAIYGLEEQDGLRYLVLEYVPGRTLAERVGARLKPVPTLLPVQEALETCQQIAEALDAAHEKGIVHRDLKPANVKLTPEGKVKVLDFGLAKAFHEEAPAEDLSRSPTVSAAATRAGVILGTAAYMSPEQARGKSLDKRTDVWAFGCVLYEALTGRQAFDRETVTDTIAAIIEREPDWQTLPGTTPANIRVLLRRCLQKDPRRRLHDIADARIEIEEALHAPPGEPAGAAAGARPELTRWRLAFPWCLVGLITIVAAVAIWSPWRASAPGRSAMRFSAVTNFAGVEAHPSLSPDGRSVAFVSDRGGQFDIWVGLVTGGSLVRITNDPNLEGRPRWSPDGAKIAYARLNDDGLWDIWSVPALGGTPRRIVANADDPAWPPDGQALAYANDAANTIWICDAAGGNARALTQPEPYFRHRQPAFSRDGRQLAFVRRAARGGPFGELAITDVSTGDAPAGKVRQLTDDSALVLSPAWSPNNAFIYFASSRGGTINIWKIALRGGLPEQITVGQGDDADLDLSADGKRLVFSSYRINMNLAETGIDSATGRGTLKWLTTDSARGEVAPAYSPDGSRIAYFSNRKGAESESIWVMDADGSNPMPLVDNGRLNIFPRWAADGQSLVYSSGAAGPGASRLLGKGEIRRVALSGGLPQKLPAETASGMWGDIGPDGRLLFLDTNRRVGLFNPKTNQTQALGAIRGALLRWSPDGRGFAYVIRPRQQNDADAGLWFYNFEGPPRQVFRGWAASYAWASRDEILVAQGRPDLNARLWRVRLDGSPSQRASASIRLIYSYMTWFPQVRFDIHPDRRRIVTEALELHEADIGMIENIQ